MRCLTLADELAANGADCQFICRAHAGNLIALIRAKGYLVHELAVTEQDFTSQFASTAQAPLPELTHARWLGVTQAQDADECALVLSRQRVDWLVVDHYAIDARWQQVLTPYYHRLMVVDDLADRQHLCHLLLDQTHGRQPEDYLRLVPVDCQVLAGAHYALLRPEFAALRSHSLQRRAKPAIRKLLLTMGGVDKENATGKVMLALRGTALPPDCQITVVMGPTAPWLEKVAEQARLMPWLTQVVAGVTNMAELMAESDLAIGAAGATTWERCCLGLPSLMIVLAENQRYAASILESAQVVGVLDLEKNMANNLARFIHEIISSNDILLQMSNCASEITDGLGAKRVADRITQKELT
ncbi:UDP-2,4-diacetamido-2,4,6-trideoxy-beta-L-altropyranose hydrolase [Vogesella sp. DC21W]|uniref:UDP-2,4-diacetamido-2,4, 6-trideoxy-beta-L-altropyranose hydrolase n=1 Tax=Vogesella aquatica TaxID=2984206 RepID=A0ABT5IWK3_9NEIS|nr:UDP-2,4-diacetamido-2,4,6-trideoxy-beta-L-altropyranose hydrolase [Vogesella aquatica]MDC7716941.1 UDP-2,4-diacetamido-2,4,6-trideoxy-beta-L-altropyranose hydrolase [Vogesella aquatica]